MTSSCIFKDTLRNHTQVFLKFRDSIIETCLHLINSNFASYFLPSSLQSSGAGTSNEFPLHESGLAISAILITLPFSFSDISYSLDLFIQFCFFNYLQILQPSWRHLIHHRIRLTLMFFMWNNHPMTKAYPDPIRRLFKILQRNQVMIPEKWYLYHHLHRPNHTLWRSMMTQISLQYHTVLDGSFQLFPQTWTT